MDWIMEKILKEYQEYLERLAAENSEEIFTNAGIEHASVLMATMFKNTQCRIRMYSTGLRPNLITTEPYFEEFKKFFNNMTDKDVSIMVEELSAIDALPFTIVKSAMRKFPDKIKVRLIKPEDRAKINEELGFEHCNFTIFDGQRFRLEYEPSEYKAIGSFNHNDWAERLIALYDNAFNSGDDIN